MKTELGPAPRDLISFELLMLDSGLGQHAANALEIRVFVVAQPEHAGLLKYIPADARSKFAPHRQRPHGPARVKLIRTISHADHTGFTARTGAAVGGAVGIEQGNGGAVVSQEVRCPRAEDTGSDNDKVVSLHFCRFAPNCLCILDFEDFFRPEQAV